MRTLGALVFPGFELLDLFGPLEMFGLLGDDVTIRIVAIGDAPVRSGQGPAVAVDQPLDATSRFDILLVPGGLGTRPLVSDRTFIDQLAQTATRSDLVATVCTGSALLARTGLLDGRKATTNKAAYGWVGEQGPKVAWQPKARWVEDGNIFTSSGVSAGIDMSLAVIARLFGEDRADEVATIAEYDRHRDPAWDPFAARYGLA